jgi:hypothetical protein
MAHIQPEQGANLRIAAFSQLKRLESLPNTDRAKLFKNNSIFLPFTPFNFPFKTLPSPLR